MPLKNGRVLDVGFTFTPVDISASPDIKIDWVAAQHGDGFDLSGSRIAHARSLPHPLPLPIHFDNTEVEWTIDPNDSDKIDIETVALHEIGHILGLGHSSVNGPKVMWDNYPGVLRSLQVDDLKAIQARYPTPSPLA